MIKVLAVLGTRPEAIKLAPVIKELERRGGFDVRVCVTAQHRQLLDPMLDLFGIEPDYDLDVMSDDQSPTDVTVAVLSGLSGILRSEEPDWVLVQGDTTTTMAGGLGAFHHGSRIAHVEAGLRTFDHRDPWPEEMNRRVAGVVAELHFAPTSAGADNLHREGVPSERVYVTGNTVIDALQMVAAMPFDPNGTVLDGIPLEGKRLIVATMHRRDTSRKTIREICQAIARIAAAHDDVHVVCPVHPNPNVYSTVHELLGQSENITLLPPLEYQPMIWLLRRSYFVITDSGGLQEEATAIGKPVLVVRGTTERGEGVAAGTAQLVGTNKDEIEAAATRLLADAALYERMAKPIDAYGTGDAARQIVDTLAAHSSSARS